jgi:hypothetical protein
MVEYGGSSGKKYFHERLNLFRRSTKIFWSKKKTKFLGAKKQKNTYI